ncbi:MAG TPA: acyl-CoA carboxylase epsilon subunit [Microbacteriaceae bacterium]|nr:acyl-CoA carboxylase epsilon subunit [Microbacteriaceae bacterium]
MSGREQGAGDSSGRGARGDAPQPPVLDASDLVFETPNLTPAEIAATTAVVLAAAKAQAAATVTKGRDPGAGWRHSVRHTPALRGAGEGQWARQFRAL